MRRRAANSVDPNYTPIDCDPSIASYYVAEYPSQGWNQDYARRAVRMERRLELAMEGHRWFDLRRYAVCKTYPYSKPIRHQFNVYESRNYHWERTDTYVLKENDPAYTFQIPQSVLEYDKVPMPANPREKRQPVGEDDE